MISCSLVVQHAYSTNVSAFIKCTPPSMADMLQVETGGCQRPLAPQILQLYAKPNDEFLW